MADKNIFVSHSKNDKEMIISFDHIFARTGVKSVCMEFEKMSTPHWDDIRQNIFLSSAIFVLLGKHIMGSIYTQNWVAFEIGLACSMGKDVWVFEQKDSKIEFPLPYATNYMLYNDLENEHVFDYIRQIINGYEDKDTYFKEVNFPWVYIPKGKKIRCSKCYADFNLHAVEHVFSIEHTINCPLCREQIEIPKPKVNEKFNKFFKL